MISKWANLIAAMTLMLMFQFQLAQMQPGKILAVKNLAA